MYIGQRKLRHLYLAKKLSSYQIAKHLDCSQSLVMKLLREYSVETRCIQEAKALTQPKYKRSNFGGNLYEKAYLIGFRLGDLYISKTHPNSPTVRVSTNTTRREQLELVRELFSPYGHVTEHRPDKRGAVSIRCFVNNSFEFLLKKDDCIETWVVKSKRRFAEFLGGYVDAEGSFINKKNRVFSIQSQQKNILTQISQNLNRYGIKCMNPRLSRKIYSISGGIRSNGDVWAIYIYNRENLLKLIKFVRNSVRHKKRRKDMIALFNSLEHVGS